MAISLENMLTPISLPSTAMCGLQKRAKHSRVDRKDDTVTMPEAQRGGGGGGG